MAPRIEARLTREYQVALPIALAPMAFVGTAPPLAIAVCEAGGLGAIAVGPLPAEAAGGIATGRQVAAALALGTGGTSNEDCREARAATVSAISASTMRRTGRTSCTKPTPWPESNGISSIRPSVS